MCLLPPRGVTREEVANIIGALVIGSFGTFLRKEASHYDTNETKARACSDCRVLIHTSACMYIVYLHVCTLLSKWFEKVRGGSLWLNRFG